MALVPGAVSEAAGRVVEEARGSVVEVAGAGLGPVRSGREKASS